MNRHTLSIVVPVYNESEGIHRFHHELENVINLLPCETEIIYVNDGSRDGTSFSLSQIQTNHPVHVIEFSRNFGKEMAMLCGLEHSTGDAVIVMDADLQHPPTLITEFYKRWRSGADIVQCYRDDNEKTSGLRKWLSNTFIKLMKSLSGINLERNLTDFCIMSRNVVNEIVKYRERRRLFRVLLLFTGFNRETLSFVAPARQDGVSKFSFFRLISLAVDSFTSMSSFPLYVSFFTGVFMFIIACLQGVYAVYVKLFSSNPLPGWASIVGWLSLFGGIQLIMMGLLGLYVARIFDEVKGRPLYIVGKRYFKHAKEEVIYEKYS